MTTREFLTSTTIILVAMALAACIEAVLPLFGRTPMPGRRQTNLGMMTTALLSNWALTSAAAVIALALSLQRPGLMERLGIPFPAQLLVSVVVLDFFFGYLAHRAMHASPRLWPMHRVHHSDPFVDLTTTYRTHPLEVAWRFLFMIAPVWLLGIPAESVLIYRLISAINGVLEHANLRPASWLDRALSVVWVTPNMHKVHHSRQEIETNSNYGNIFSVYDRMMGTFTPTERAFTVTYGLDDVDPIRATSLPALLAMPFRSAEVETPGTAAAAAMEERAARPLGNTPARGIARLRSGDVA